MNESMNKQLNAHAEVSEHRRHEHRDTTKNNRNVQECVNIHKHNAIVTFLLLSSLFS